MGFLILSRIRKLTERKDARGLIEIALKESDPQVRIAAINSLGVIRATVAVESLAEILENERRIDVRKATAVALGKIGSSKAIVPLVEFLKKEQDVVWQIIEEALISINDASVIKELEKIYTEKGYEYAKKCADNVIMHYKNSPKPKQAEIGTVAIVSPEKAPPEKVEIKVEDFSQKVEVSKTLEVKSEAVNLPDSQQVVVDKKVSTKPKQEDCSQTLVNTRNKFSDVASAGRREPSKGLSYYVQNIKLLSFSEIESILAMAEQFSVDEIISYTEGEDPKRKNFAVSLLGKLDDDKSAKKLLELALSDDVFTRIAAIVALYSRKSFGALGSKQVVNLIFEPVSFLRALIIGILKKNSTTFADEITRHVKGVHCNYVRGNMVALLLEQGLIVPGSILEVLSGFYRRDSVFLTQILTKKPNYFIELLDIRAIRDDVDTILFLSKLNVPMVTGYLAGKVEKYEKNVDVFETLLTHFYLSGINEYISIPISYLYKDSEKLRILAAKVLLANKWKPTNSKDYVAVLVAGNFWDDIEKKGETVLKYISHFMYFNDLKEKIVSFCSKIGGLTAAEFLSNYFIDKDSSIQLNAIKSFDSLGIEPSKHVFEQLKLALYSDTVFVQKEALRVLEKIGWKPELEKEEIICKIIKNDWDSIRIFDPESEHSIKASMNNKSWVIRQKAIALLADINYPSLMKDILMMLNDKEKQVQVVALKALVYFYDNNSTAFSNYLLDSDPDVRMAAAIVVNKAEKKDLCDEILANAILGNSEFFKEPNKQTVANLLRLFEVCEGIHKEEVVSILLRMGWKPESGEQKILAAAVLRDFEFLEKSGNGGLVYLVSMTSDFDSKVSQKAVDTIVKIGKDALFYVMELLKSDLWSERKIATDILGKIQCDESFHALSELAFSDKNNTVRLSAIKALSFFNSCDVVNILCDLCFAVDDSIKGEVFKIALKFQSNRFFQLFLLEKSNDGEDIYNRVFELCSEENSIELLKAFLFAQNPKIRLQAFRHLPFLKRKGIEIKGDGTDFQIIENSGITGYIPYKHLI